MSTDHNARQLIALVAQREILTRVRAKSWRIITVLLMALMVGLALLSKIAGGTSELTVGLDPSTQSLRTALVATARTVGTHISVRSLSDSTSGVRQVRAGDLDALVTESGDALSVVVKEDVDSGLDSALTVLARQLAAQRQITELGGDPAAFETAVASAHVDITRLAPRRAYSDEHLALGVAAGIIVFLALQLNGQLVAQGVVEEKSTRVVELLLATLRPWELMTGKVLGLAVVGIGQLALIAGSGLASGLALGTLSLSVGQASGVLAWLVVWFVLGFSAYAMAIAAAAALVSRQEDVQNVLLPVLAPLIVSYAIGISVVPPSAPAIMPILIAIGSASPLEVVISVALMLAAIPALALLAGRIYRNAVVRSGARVSLHEALARRRG
jgi:ABC-2 type transport system permease protein